MRKLQFLLAMSELRVNHLFVSLMFLFLLPCLSTTAQAASKDTIHIVINDEFEWRSYAYKYGQTEYLLKHGDSNTKYACPYYLDVKLTHDIVIDKYRAGIWKYFNGHLDGQGHTIWVYLNDDEEENYHVFKSVCGTIENLNIKAKVEYRYGWLSYTDNGAFAYTCGGSLTMKNCHSRAEYVEVSKHNVYGSNSARPSGFLAKVEGVYLSDKGTIKSDVEFQDCSFVGSFTKKYNNDDKWYDTAGFIGSKSWTNVTFKNCLSVITFSSGPKASDDTGYFIGDHASIAGDIKTENCYCYSGSTIADKLLTDGATVVSSYQLKSGEVAAKLAAGRTGDGNPWRQTIGYDTTPETNISSPTSMEVFHAEAVTRPATTDKWTTLFYPKNFNLGGNTKRYIVTAENSSTLSLSEVNPSSSTANIPMLMYSENGFSAITLPATYYNKREQKGYLRGAYTTTAKADAGYTLDGANAKFIPATGDVSTWQCYLTGGTDDAYELDNSSKVGTAVISSKEEWNALKDVIGTTEVNVYLDCDLTLTKDDEAMESFQGTLDGQGHSIIYDYDLTHSSYDQPKCYGFINKATGTIKNLNITGEIRTMKYWPSPLFCTTNGGTLNVENCHSDVLYNRHMQQDDDPGGAGFCCEPGNSTINFKDCWFDGALTSYYLHSAGGFIETLPSGSKVTFTNCYSILSPTKYSFGNDTSSDYADKIGYFVGVTNGNYSLKNCWALNTGTVGINTTSRGEIITTEAALANGDLTEALNAGRTGDDAPWMQVISPSKRPILKVLKGDNDHTKYIAGGTIAKNPDAKWTTLCYPVDVTLPSDLGIVIYDKFDTDDEGNLLLYENLSGTVKAGTPAILYAANGFTEDITLPAQYYDEAEVANATTYFTGVDADTDAASRYVLSNTGTDDPAISAAAEGTTIHAWQCYANKPYAKLIPDGGIIYSKDNWNFFKTKYNGKKQGFARLATDLTLGSTDEPMENFVGTFDGQGHTVTVNFTNHDGYRAMFKQAKGSTIRNLNLAGTITTSTNGSLDQAPLIYTVEGTQGAPDTLTVENCHSSVRFIGENNSNIIWAGGFVRYVQTYATVNFTDCSFTGGFETKGQVTNSGGFIGLNYTNGTANTVNFTNCFSAPTDCTIGSTDSRYPIGYFCGGTMSKLTYNVTNCYARKATGITNKDNKITLLDSATVAKGSATYALNAGRSGNAAPWGQTVGTDSVPMLKLFSAESAEVQVTTDTVKIGTAGWSTHYYPLAEALPDGVKAYKVSGVSNEQNEYIVNLEEVTGTIPAYTPVLLCTLGEGQTEAETTITINMPPAYYNKLQEQDINDTEQAFFLLGVTRATEAFDGCYVLQRQTGANGKKTTAFYRVDTNKATPTIPAWKCVLVYNANAAGSEEEAASEANAIRLHLDDEATSINVANAINGIISDGKTYDLQGRRVQSLQKGVIYIKNGQKFIVR